MKTIITLLLCISIATAQQVTKPYEIPFASKGNTIELSVANSSVLTAEGVKVEATSIPEGIEFKEKAVSLTLLKSKEEQTALFIFSVNKLAKVNKEQTLSFSITDNNGQVWKKEITVKIAPPTNYELFQNYPNPFNPTTVISYQLPSDSKVALKIYDMLGREVANPVNEQQDAGYHQTTIDAHSLASGTYIYRFIALDEQNNRHVFQKKMVVLK
jgi:hypothetical protein